MIPFDDTPATRVALTRALLQTMNGGGKQPPPDYPPVTYANANANANEDNLCATHTGLATASAGCKPIATICTGNIGSVMRPDYADDIDAIVQAMVADGDVKLVNDAYVGTRGAHWRWTYQHSKE